jgi:hypothetical protein
VGVYYLTVKYPHVPVRFPDDIQEPVIFYVSTPMRSFLFSEANKSGNVNVFLTVLHTTLALMLIYCRYISLFL